MINFKKLNVFLGLDQLFSLVPSETAKNAGDTNIVSLSLLCYGFAFTGSLTSLSLFLGVC